MLSKSTYWPSWLKVGAENGNYLDGENELIVHVWVLKRKLAQTIGECQSICVRGQYLLVSGFSLLVPHAATLTPLMWYRLKSCRLAASRSGSRWLPVLAIKNLCLLCADLDVDGVSPMCCVLKCSSLFYWGCIVTELHWFSSMTSWQWLL